MKKPVQLIEQGKSLWKSHTFSRRKFT